MRLYKVLSYLAYTVVLLGSLIAGSWVVWSGKVWTGRTYQPLPGLFASTAVYIIVGVLLGFEHLLMEFRKSGKWSIRKTRLIVVGVPLAIVAFYLIFSFGFSLRLPALPDFIFNTNILFDVSGVMFGYILVTSFYKRPLQLDE